MKKIFFIMLMIISSLAYSQSYKYAFYCLDTLTSKTMSGRGYQYDGNLKAATFIKNELANDGLTLMGDNGFQQFPININNIKSMRLAIHNKDSIKIEGVDYLVFGSSASCYKKIENTKCLVFNDKEKFTKVDFKKLNNKVLIFNQNILSYHDIVLFIRKIKDNFCEPNLIIIQGYDKIQYPISTSVYRVPVLLLKGVQIPKNKIDYLELNIESEYVEDYKTQNVWAKIDGTRCKDSCFMIVSHYDHLGMCGKAMFPGAADNASGTCVNLDLAKYYAKHPSPYTMVFLFCSGEEIGLYGSKYAADNPLVDLSKVKFLLNLDMCGTGSQGVAVINGKNHSKEGEILKRINDENRAFLNINLAENSCNSDHCPFDEKGVPAFFIFTYGKEYNEYHTIYDDGKTLPFTKHLDFCNLLKEFISEMSKE